jgi:endoribonuclease Dicer
MDDERENAMDQEYDSDNEDAIPPPTAGVIPPQVVANARLAQDRTSFDSWLRDQREKVYKEAQSKATDSNRSTLSRANWVDEEDAPIISSPREYQTELFERAKKKNIIAVLDTGCLMFPCYFVLRVCRLLTWANMQELARPLLPLS